MKDIIEGAAYLNIPIIVVSAIVGLFFVMQIIGAIIDFKTKAAPEILAIWKYFKRKRMEKAITRQIPETLKQVQALLDDVNKHYSTDNITRRDNWMGWVNHQAEVYDTSIADLEKKMDKNNEITLALLIDSKRNTIIDFASKVVDENYPVTREQFKRIFKIYEEYESIIDEHGLTNGEVDVAYRIINESYENHMYNHSFIEDIKGY